jgi:hypothetical protein
LVAHFFRRAFHLLRRGGALGLIATKTIREGDTRTSGLMPIREAGGVIYAATRRIKWPGEANVTIALVHISKDSVKEPYLLDDRPVQQITSFLFHTGPDTDPAKLATNASKSFQGSIILGIGFTFANGETNGVAAPLAEMYRLIENDSRNQEVIFPYIGYAEVANSPTHAHSRYVISLGEWSEEECRGRWPDLMAMVEAKVKPERSRQKDEYAKKLWWRFLRHRPELYTTITGLKRVLVAGSQASAHHALAFLATGVIYSSNLSVLAIDEYAGFAALQSRVHEVWARFFMSTMEDRLAYTPTTCFEPFPFPPDFERDPTLEAAGEAYYRLRAELMVARDRGLTRTYNDFHDRRLRNDPQIERLRELHHAMDQAVLRAYGWEDLAAAAAPVFLDEESEDEFAYQGRLFWPSDFRDEVLARLLALNAERHADEVRRGVAPRQSARGHATEGDSADEEDAA